MKKASYVAAFVGLVITLILIPCPTYAQPSQGDVACPQQNDPLCPLAQRFRPFLRFSYDYPQGSGTYTPERHHPTSWQWFISNSSLESYQWCKGHPDGCFVKDYGPQSAAGIFGFPLADMRGYTYDQYSNTNVLNAEEYPWYWLYPSDNTGEDWTAQYSGDFNAVAGDGLYAHVEPINADLVNIEYWALYSYNEGLNNGWCKFAANVGREVFNHEGDLDFGYALVYSKSAEAAGIGHDGIIRVTITQHGKIILIYDLTSSSSVMPVGTWGPSDFYDLSGESYNYLSLYQIQNAYESQYCTVWGPGGCLAWLHYPCSWGGSPPNGGGAQVTFVQDPVSGLYDHLAVWPEWGSHEFWPGSCGDNTCLPAHTGNGPAYLPSEVTYLGTLSYLLNAPDYYQENAPFAFYNGRWGTDPDPAMLHNEWYYPLQRGIDPCGQENPLNIGTPVQTGSSPTDTTARGFDDSGDAWSNPYCVLGCYYSWGVNSPW